MEVRILCQEHRQAKKHFVSCLDVAKEKDIITPELKEAGNILVRFDIEKDKYDLPVFSQIKELYAGIHAAIQSGAGECRNTC